MPKNSVTLDMDWEFYFPLGAPFNYVVHII